MLIKRYRLKSHQSRKKVWQWHKTLHAREKVFAHKWVTTFCCIIKHTITLHLNFLWYKSHGAFNSQIFKSANCTKIYIVKSIWWFSNSFLELRVSTKTNRLYFQSIWIVLVICHWIRNKYKTTFWWKHRRTAFIYGSNLIRYV